MLDPPGRTPVDAPNSPPHKRRAHLVRWGWAHVPSWVRWGAGCGAVAALPLIGMLVALFRAGWAPIDDEATIAWQSWDVLAGHGPLVGHFTAASLDLQHPVFDPGPLLYWTFAIPVHLSPRTGLLVGVTLLGVASVVVACLAAADVGGRSAALIVGLGALIVGWSLSAQLDSTLWNPYAALAPFGATLIVAWAVAAGRLGWWPCLVVLTSFCAQAHLLYALGSMVLLVVAPLLGVVAARRSTSRVVGWRWAAAGVAVGAVCWAAPAWQQLTASRGNLSALWAATSHRGATTGLDLGLRNLSRGVALPRPVWLQPPTRQLILLEMPSVTWAIVTLTALVVVAGLGYWRRHHVVTAVSVVALLGDLSVVWAIGAIPVKQAIASLYMQYVLWLVGAMTWFALGYAVVALAGRRVAAFASVRLTGSTRQPGRVAPVLGILLVVASAFTTYWQFRDAASLGELGPSGGRARLTEATDRIAALVGSAPSHGNTRLAIETPEPWSMERGISVLRTAYLLRVRGWTPAVIAPGLRAQLDPVYSPRPDDPVLGVTAGPVPAGARLLGEVDFGDTTGPVHWTVWLRLRSSPK